MIEVPENLKKEGDRLKILYVEDNKGLQKNIATILEEIFTHVFIAGDGEEGFELFKAHDPDLIITDIKMPKMDGLTLISKIRKLDREKRVIIVSAIDEKQNLIEAIRLKVFRYVSKPTKADEFLGAISDALDDIKESQTYQIYQRHVQDILNYQNNLVIMMEAGKPVIINQRFLEFCGVEDIEMFLRQYPDLEGLLGEHEGFLYSKKAKSWQDQARENMGQLFHAKIADPKGAFHHFIMKAIEIPEQEDDVIFSFNDITELNLMQLFDKQAVNADESMRSEATAVKMLKVIKDNHARLKLHNFYRGLSIINDAILVSLEEEKIVLKTHYAQLKIIKLAKHFTISSEAIPDSILCTQINAIDFDKQTVEFHGLKFQKKSAADRQHTRLEVDRNSTASIIFKGVKYLGKTRLYDISKKSARIGVATLPSGIKANEDLRISFVLALKDRHPTIINTMTRIEKVQTSTQTYFLIVSFSLEGHDLELIKEYLSARQIALVNEYKNL